VRAEGNSLSKRRPSRRYIGFRIAPSGASRREVQAALDAAWRHDSRPPAEVAPRLLVCEAGVGIAVVPTPQASAARRAIAAGSPRAAVRLTPEVTSGTIITVKERMGVSAKRPRRA